MTVRVSLDKSLVIRYGNATYQLNRVLRDGGSSVQFENQKTGQFKEFELSKFYSMLQSKQLTVVQGEAAEKKGDTLNRTTTYAYFGQRGQQDSGRDQGPQWSPAAQHQQKL